MELFQQSPLSLFIPRLIRTSMLSGSGINVGGMFPGIPIPPGGVLNF